MHHSDVPTLQPTKSPKLATMSNQALAAISTYMPHTNSLLIHDVHAPKTLLGCGYRRVLY